MKTLNDFKQQVATKYGLSDWDDLKGQFAESYYEYCDQAAELYAAYRAQEALSTLSKLIRVTSRIVNTSKVSENDRQFLEEAKAFLSDNNVEELNIKQSTVVMNKHIPYQKCPICNGEGKVIADGFTSALYTTCTVCNGNKIIVPFIVNTESVYTEAWNAALDAAVESVGLSYKSVILKLKK